MPYDILTDDVVDPPKRPRRGRNQAQPQDGYNIKPFYVHFAVIVLILLLLMVYLLSGISKNFNTKETGILTVIGEMENFDRSYSGYVKVDSTSFTIETESGVFDETSKEIELFDFNGDILLENQSIVFTGTAQEIKFGRNVLNVGGKTFNLTSKRRTSLTLHYPVIDLNFTKGTAKLDSHLEYDFVNSTVGMIGINMTMTYDGTFSISGKPAEFRIDSPDSDLEIVYRVS